jgi:hypothetical protein
MLTCLFLGLPRPGQWYCAILPRIPGAKAGAVVTVVKKKGAAKLLPLTAPRLRAEALRN